MRITESIDNTGTVIDSRDVIRRIDFLADFVDQVDEDELDDDEVAELRSLRALAEEGEIVPDWDYGATLINDEYFTTYAKELAQECDDLPTGWPVDHIDWDAAADALKADYTPLDFDGVTFWVLA